uniref:Uncharacterized protein n=1 Tax=Streptomyces sp. FR1 TaxID=349971 RepID=V9Z5S5_9ACTN|nr:hypothetical protein pFRL2_76 [Streptomyces sp. FR1]
MGAVLQVVAPEAALGRGAAVPAVVDDAPLAGEGAAHVWVTPLPLAIEDDDVPGERDVLAHRQPLMRNATDTVELPITLRVGRAQPGGRPGFCNVAMPPHRDFRRCLRPDLCEQPLRRLPATCCPPTMCAIHARLDARINARLGYDVYRR